jgi:hypothetical protein
MAMNDDKTHLRAKRHALAACCLLLAFPLAARGQTADAQAPSSSILQPAQWKAVDASVDRGLAWLASQQRPDGSFPTYESGQPGVTSLAVMAFLSRGHRPGAGPYGRKLERAIDFVLAQQQDDGLLYGASTSMPTTVWYQGSHTAMYNHAIAGLMLGEAFGMTGEEQTKKLRPAIEKALDFARRMQRRPSPYEKDAHAWRYFKHHGIANKGEADLSVTGWFIMFYRSAKNAEFEVPEEYVREAVQFVRACYREDKGDFLYGPYPDDRHTSRAMNGAGLLCLTITGNYDPKIADAAGQWILKHPFTDYNVPIKHDRYHYGAYYCSQAMFMLGGKYWQDFYPPLTTTLLQNQSPQGYWQPESANYDNTFGNSYTTALAILSMTPPYQLLPIYQR